MRLARIPVSAGLILFGLILQVSVFGRLQLPGATPDILLLVVVGLAMVYGPTGGCLVGFAAGLLADLAPPSDHAIGRYALVLCLMGYAAGLLRPDHGRQRSVSSALLVVGAAAVASTLLYAMVGALVGDTAARHVGLVGLVISALLYDLLLAPFVVPLVMMLGRRFGRDPVAAADDDENGPGLGLGSLARATRSGAYPASSAARNPSGPDLPTSPHPGAHET
jgi:rod shape-determining protein MreD